MTRPPGLPTLDDVASLAAELSQPFPVADLAIGAGVVSHLRDTVDIVDPGGAGALAIVADDVSYDGPEGPIKPAVEHMCSQHRPTRQVTLRNGVQAVHADEGTLDEATAGCAGATALITVGSGTITDIGKVVAKRLDIPHVVVQTAASVNGFTNNQSVLLVAGVKRTTPSRWPSAIVIDTDIVAAAPAAMNLAGIGDLLSMFTAPADWLIASTVGIGPAYHRSLIDLVRPHGDRLLDLAERPGDGEHNADDLVTLSQLLSLSGFSIGLAGTTAPSSGLEHVISHLLEMHALAHGLEPSLHGLQAGLGTVVAAVVWDRVRIATDGGTLPLLRLPDSSAARHRVFAAFGSLGEKTAGECWTAYETKLAALAGNRDMMESLRETWPDLLRDLDGLLALPKRLAGALQLPSGPVRFANLPTGFDEATVRWAITHGHRMRDRFVVSDLAELLGLWTDEFIDEVLVDLDTLGVLA